MNANRRRVLVYAEQGEWDEVVALLADSTSLAKAQDDFGMLPLHWACTEPSIPLDVFKAILDAFPDGCRIENLSGMLPLHVAINAKIPGLHINALLQAYPEAALKKDGIGRYPLEFAMECNLPKFTLNLIRKASGRAMRSMSVMGINTYEISSIASVDNQSDDEDYLDRPTGAFSKARSLGSMMASREASMYAKLVDEKLPNAAMNPMDSVQISTQLRDLLSQLQQLSTDIRSTTSSAASTYRSSFSTSSSSTMSSLSSTANSVLWNPGDKLGIVLEAASNGTGAKIKRFGSKSNALGIEQLSIGDVLVSINGTPVSGTSYASITRFMKNAKVACTLSFSKFPSYPCGLVGPLCESPAGDNDTMVFAKLADLLETTMKRVTAVEETVRLTSTMSFIA